MKKEISISLDSDILEAMDRLCEKSFGAKRSTLINSILKEHTEIKKILNKLKKKK